MFATFISIIYLGHLAASLLIVISNVMVFKEINALARSQARVKLSLISQISNWYFFLLSMYFLIGRVFYGRFAAFFYSHSEPLAFLCEYHVIVSFGAYLAGFVVFVLSLENGKYKAQFKQLAWTHMAMLSVALQTSFWISNIFQGFIWFILPTSLVIVNDTFSYIFGFFWGRTRLIEISPNKTWEGFIGGMVSTLGISVLLAYCLSSYSWMTTLVWKWLVPYLGGSLPLSPIVLHGFALGLFASLVAPYGGFFASGLKRAFGLKDFGSILMGHGGLTDRTDCQFFMGTFTYIYITTFLRRLPIVPY
eukprot:gene7961-9355_t